MLLSLLAKARQKKDADDDVTVFLQRIVDGFLDFTSKELKVASLTIEGMPRGWYLHLNFDSFLCRCLALYSSNSCEEEWRKMLLSMVGMIDLLDMCQDACSRDMYIYKMCI